MVAVKKEDGSLDTSSVSMEKFTVDGMVAESIIKKVNSQQSVMLLFTSKDNKIADVFCEVTGVIQAPRSKIWVSGVFPHKDGINLYCQNGQVVALPPQESRRLIDSCRFCFRAKDSDTKVQMTVNYNGNTYELIFDSSLNAALEGYKKTMTKNSLKVNKADYPTEKYTGTRGVTQLYAEQKNEKIEENLSTSASWLKSTKWIGGGIVTAAFFLSVFYYMYKNGVAFGDVASELAKMVKFKA